MLRAAAAVVLALAAGAAQACMFVRDVPPESWYEWSSALFAGEVTRVEEDAAKAIDTIAVKVTEVFKGPPAESATLTMTVRLRRLCRLELPRIGERILVALNEHNDSAWVPLGEAFAERLRREKRR
ncbi:MAG TPA: hypothetical protein VF211_05140 [Burkholderiales bacterium]